MPKYQITSPDGRKFEVTAPDGATQEQVLAYAQQQYGGNPPQDQQFDPTANMSTGKKFLAGVGKGFVDIGRGVGQKLGLVTQEDIDAARELDAPLMRTGAGVAGNLAGNIAATLPTAFIPGVNTVAGGAATGAVLGALQPTGTGESSLNNAIAGGVVGGALPAVTNSFKALKAGLYDPIGSQDKIIASTLTKASGNDPKALVQALRQGGANTQGVNLTASQLSRNEGLAAIEDALRAQNPSGELARNAQNNRTALASALRSIAGTPEDMASAMLAREGAADALYSQAFKSDAMRKQVASDLNKASSGLFNAGGIAPSIDLGTEGLRALQSRPMFNSAVEQAKTLAANKGVNIGNPVESLQGLHYIKLALDDMANPLASTAIGKNNLSAVNSIREELTNELAKVSPLYGNARKTFQQMSEPINQMQVGEALAKKLIPSTADDVPASLNYSTFANAMRNPDQIAQQATGFKGARMAEILKDKMPIVEGVNADASRIAEAIKRGSGQGSATARRLAQGDMLAQYFSDQAPITSSVISAISKVPGGNVATKGISTIGGLVTDKIKSQMLNRMDDMLANNPKQVADLISQELARIEPSQRQLLISRLPQSIVLSLPASVNAAQ